MIDFKKELLERTARIDKIVNSYLPEISGRAEYIKSAMDYSVQAGGKRIRPMIMLETYRLCGGTDEKCVYPFMAALEMIHTYSLVHDDLPAMDNDDYRRGKLTTHKKYGEDFGILAGDGLLNLAYETMFNAIKNISSDYADIENAKKMALYSQAAAVIASKAGVDGMVGGQSLDVYLTDKPMDKEQLDYIFRLKTGALIEAAFMAGAILAGADDRTVEKMEKAGNLIGVAFQIQDDILDVTSTQEVLGKPVLSDEKNHKSTYVTLGSLESAKALAQEAVDKAKASLVDFGENAEFLRALVDYLITRNK